MKRGRRRRGGDNRAKPPTRKDQRRGSGGGVRSGDVPGPGGSVVYLKLRSVYLTTQAGTSYPGLLCPWAAPFLSLGKKRVR